MKSVFHLFCAVSLLVAGDSLATTTTNQPPSPSCTLDDIGDFYMNQLQWDECQSSAATLFSLLEATNSESFLEGLDDALNNILCTPECGERVANWYYSQCDDHFFASRIYYSCLDPGTTAVISHCLYALQPLYNITLTLPSCLNSEANSCTSSCSEELDSVKTELGCCFNSIYNETESLSFLVEGGILDQSVASRLQNLGSSCSVTAPVACTVKGIRFPGDDFQVDDHETQVTDILCPEVDTGDLLSGSLPDNCPESLFTIVNSTALSPGLDDVLDVFCTQECGGTIASALRTHCSDNYFTNGFYYFCLGTEYNSATIGSRCRYAFPPQYNLTSYLIQCVSVATEISSCPEGCSQVLEMISADIGCCYNSIYNNTAPFPIQSLARDETVLDEPPEAQFRIVANPQFWSSCGVNLPPGPCTNEGFIIISAAEGKHSLSNIPFIVILVYITAILISD
jgi:hypothetical protein